ncbi:MAG TPA: hypothetical protein VKS21_02315 [Spirochaetota bacterium]|nr:hypothetical protein [Spirochaetota bacterium]
MSKQILKELKNHVPFSAGGAVSGILLIILLQEQSPGFHKTLFYILHPIHVVLSAFVTASIYKLHTCDRFNAKCIRGRCNFWLLSLIGYSGAIGIATLSDSIIPFLGEILLDMPNRGIHLGFIEKWWLVNPLAVIGILFAYYMRPHTVLPHAGHVLLSTWASLFHILMATGNELTVCSYITLFLFLFTAVWIPCCLSDIVFPLLFVKAKK